MKEFQPGFKLKTVSGGTVEIIEKLGEGGQGVVYKVAFCGRQMALKWYYPKTLKNPKAFYKSLERNINKGAPTDKFLWPEELTEKLDNSFGYLMRLRPPEYKDFSLFLLAKIHFSGVAAVTNAALSIINSFRELHRMGYSYQDLNDGNFFINPQTGDVLICDNDNVVEDGENLGIAGKCRYMAPEIVLGRKKYPDKYTDYFSLSVVLYLILFLSHPLEGSRTMCPCMTEAFERRYYAEEPVFVWDEENKSNRPVQGVHVNEIALWPLYPKFIRDTFAKAFSKNLMIGEDIEHRITDYEWQRVFTRLKGWTIKCKCGNDTFIDLDAENYRCICCRQEIRKIMLMQVKRNNVVLAPGQCLYEYHTRKSGDDYRKITGKVVVGKDKTVLGLQNLSEDIWTAYAPNGKTIELLPGKVIKLGNGLQIDFETKENTNRATIEEK